jgi:tetratricopeptide (TPR) repeat protein
MIFVLKDTAGRSSAPTSSPPAPAPAPTPLASSRPSELDLKRQAADLLVEASRLEKSGEYDLASRLLNRARRTSLGIGDSPGVARAHLSLARLERARGRSIGAGQEYGRALELYQKLGQSQTVEMIETEVGALPAKD